MVTPFYSIEIWHIGWPSILSLLKTDMLSQSQISLLGLSFLSCLVVENSVTRNHSAEQTVTVYLNT